MNFYTSLINTTPLSNQDIIAIASLVTASIALVATFWQNRLTKQHNQKSTTPLLTFHSDSREGLVISIHNDGIGPAIITQFKYFIDGIPYKTDQKFIELLNARPDLNSNINVVTPHAHIGVGNSILLLSLSPNTKGGPFDISFCARIGFQVHYESIYGNKFQTEVLSPLYRDDLTNAQQGGAVDAATSGPRH